MFAKSFTCLVLLAISNVAMAQREIIVNSEPHHDSTAAGNYLRTYGRYLEGVGLGAKHYAEGVKTMMQAQAMAQKNAYDRVQLRRQLQDEWQMRRVASQRPRPSLDVLQQQARAAAPARLNSTQLQPSGEVQWTEYLMGDAFAELRTELQTYFADCSGGQLDAQRRIKAINVCDRMLAQLQGNIRQVPTGEYLKSRKLIASLKYEAQLAK